MNKLLLVPLFLVMLVGCGGTTPNGNGGTNPSVSTNGNPSFLTQLTPALTTLDNFRSCWR